MDFSVIQDLEKAGTFAHQKDESVATFTPSSFRKVPAEAPILTQTIRINFYPNSANVYEPQHDENGKPIANTLYDPSVGATLEKVRNADFVLDGKAVAGVATPEGGYRSLSTISRAYLLPLPRASIARRPIPRSSPRWSIRFDMVPAV
jgi:hypothetical protein